MYIKFIRTHVGDRDREETWDLFRQDIAKDLLRKLSPREQKILELRSGLKDGAKHTLRETAENFGITRERVRQIQNAALIKIRELMMMNGKKAIDIAFPIPCPAPVTIATLSFSLIGAPKKAQ